MKRILFICFLLLSIAGFAQNSTAYDSLNTAVVKLKANSLINSNDHRVINVLQALSDETLQSDEGELTEATRKTYLSMLKDPKLANRHLLYLYQAYTDNISRPEPNPYFQQACALLLFEEFIDTYDTAPAVVLIFMGESLMSGGNNPAAAEHFKKALDVYPDSVPLMVYRWKLTEDTAEKKKLYDKLKKKHPKHWMVQQMLK